jgi:hypothetical protein
MACKRRLNAGNLDDLTRILWRTIVEVEGLLDTRPPSNDLILRSAHALAQLAGAYRGILEVVDLDKYRSALEQWMAETNYHGAIS